MDIIKQGDEFSKNSFIKSTIYIKNYFDIKIYTNRKEIFYWIQKI